MENEQTITVAIEDLRITADVHGRFLRRWIRENGDSVKMSPHYLYLMGDYEPMRDWMKFRRLPLDYITSKMMATLQSLIWEGQKEPIKIYKDMRINTGHKRAACMLFLREKIIKAVIVPDDYKL